MFGFFQNGFCLKKNSLDFTYLLESTKLVEVLQKTGKGLQFPKESTHLIRLFRTIHLSIMRLYFSQMNRFT